MMPEVPDQDLIDSTKAFMDTALEACLLVQTGYMVIGNSA